MVFFPRDSLPKIKAGVHVKNLKDKKSNITHWIS